MKPLVATILGTLWVVIVVVAYLVVGFIVKDSMWWTSGIFLMVVLSVLPFAIYDATNEK